MYRNALADNPLMGKNARLFGIFWMKCVLTEFNMVVGGAYFHISREFVNAHCPCENLCKKRKLAEKEAGCLLNINIGQIFMEAHPAARVKLQIKPREKLVCFQRYELKLCSIQSSF